MPAREWTAPLHHPARIGNIVVGRGASAIGTLNTVVGASSLAYGEGSQTSSYGPNSLAGGFHAIAAAKNSVALGDSTTAYSHSSLAIGRYNKPVGDESTNLLATSGWRPQDSLFVIGNGDSSTARSNALVVTKDGTVIIPKRQGDISMGDFTTQ